MTDNTTTRPAWPRRSLQRAAEAVDALLAELAGAEPEQAAGLRFKLFRARLFYLCLMAME